MVHYDQSTDPKLNFHIGRRHTSRTTSRTCLFGPETPFQAATHPENLETQNTLYRLQQRVCWSMGSLGSGPQPGSSCGSRRQRRRGCPWAPRAPCVWPCRGGVLPDHRELVDVESGTSSTLDTMNDELRQPDTACARDCHAVWCGVWRVSGGTDTPCHEQNSS